ncbi:cbb3-type cytochrome c oxidase subunit 3 [Paracoccus sp. WLY502]|uniref:cbb3-type cytochrome c oxidase subunit 3 n=1 Tax=Paracoccus yibinensis TaxID=3068891 RepID=UPI0027969109|nr:cbb3-type cytochrome c oxidase subunit 3 [Paracoccus sp. WLY502]MDQ1900459.1 cbb3-type cytochrome c oxidase subunit 3 [Paracoccus sp. WLY502]
METYSFLRGLADSWALLLLVLFFVGVILFVFRPGSRKAHRDAAESIFRNENRPADADDKEGR